MTIGRISTFVTTMTVAAALAAQVPPAPKPAATPLEAGKTQTREIAGGGIHTYRVDLVKGQFVKVTADQKGADVVLTLLAPDGTRLAEVDSPNGQAGPETVALPVEASGTYSFEVAALDPKAGPGGYSIRIVALLSPEEYSRHSIMKVDAAFYRRYAGTYRIAPDHAVTMGLFDNQGMVGLWFLDSKTLATGFLHPHSETDFFTGPNLGEEYPVTAECTFSFDAKGQPSGLTWKPRGGPAWRARWIPQVQEDVSFTNGDVTLKGFVMKPQGPGPHPAIVIAHGSGPARRDLGHVCPYFVQLGFAVLSFDKRGAGESTGDWTAASFDELAADVVAGVKYLKSRPDIDGSQIGLWGISQGGWIGTLAAGMSSDVKFLVVHAGSGVAVKDNMVHESEGAMREAGLPEKDILEAAAYLRELYGLAAAGAPFDKIAASIQTIQTKPWKDYVFLASAPRDSFWWSWFPKNGNVDSAVNLAKVRCPVLWFLGDRDSQVPTAASEPRIRQALLASGNPDHTVKVLSPAAHSFLKADTGFGSEAYSASAYVDGYWSTMAEWLGRRVHFPR